MHAYFDSGTDWDLLRTMEPELTENAARYDARKTREKLLKSARFDAAMIRRYALRPFDYCWAYYSPLRPLWNEPGRHFGNNAGQETRSS
jgi:hypothetical protein